MTRLNKSSEICRHYKLSIVYIIRSSLRGIIILLINNMLLCFFGCVAYFISYCIYLHFILNGVNMLTNVHIYIKMQNIINHKIRKIKQRNLF